MNVEKWKERPEMINYWDNEIDTMMAIDENGTNDLKSLLKKRQESLFDFTYGNPQIEESIKWFTITGVVMKRDDFPQFKEAITSTKMQYWEGGLYNYKNGTRRVVFHSREIRKSVGPFNPKLIDYHGLLVDITKLISDTPFTIYNSTINKLKHVQNYSIPFPVYDLSLDFIVERYCRELRRNSCTGALLIESRGRKEDFKILQHLVDLLENGNKFWSSDDFKCIKKIYFNPKWCSVNDYKRSFIQLELADLVSYPIHKYNIRGIKDRAFNSIQSKIYNYPNFEGYGIKVFPK
ncbi:DUF3800 domain-containing protein [Halalkalibacter alkalisediminis]|uniref:DUF3800 domain-containing protein n=1 Tax=Halalkalibacter alkalisediminis TaxID=935616 RepID=A0ABV6NJE6_9BACI|nr:DUF3800 domain-containing protein [Halalkalibacter alkalisediminis]